MAYTPPLGNAVNFDGSGAPYTPPLGNAVNFDTVGGNIFVTPVGQQATVAVGTFVPVITGADIYVALAGQQLAVQQDILLASIPGGSYSIPLVGQGATVQQGMPVGLSAYLVALTTQLLTTQYGGLAASTPTTVTVPLIGQASTTQRGGFVPKILTGVIQWNFAHGNITLSGTPKLTASTFSSPFVYVYSTGGEEAFGGKRYFEIALTAVDQAFGISNAWHGTFSASKSLGMAAAGGEDLYSWALNLLRNGTMQLQHNGTAIASGTFTYVADAPLMCALDFTSGLIWFGYNGTWVNGGNPATGVNPSYTGVTGFPHPVLILGSMGMSPPNPVAQKAVLHATINNQLYRPAGFLPWEDDDGSLVSVTLTGQKLTAQANSLDTYIVEGFNISLSLRGLPASVQLGAVGIDRDRPKVTWNPNDKSPYVALTHDNMGAVSDNPPNMATYSVRATLGRAINSGKYYFEVTVPFVQDNNNINYTLGPGIMLARQRGSTEFAENTTWNGFLTNDYGVQNLRERWYNIAFDGSPIDDPDPVHGGWAHVGDSLGRFVPGRVLQLAVDFNAGNIWFGYNGKWFNSSNGANPATGTLPQYSNIKTIITTVAFAEYPSCIPDYIFGEPPPPSVIGHFSATSFKFEPPAGFAPWEDPDPVDRVAYLTGQKLLVWGTPFWHLTGQELTIKNGQFSGVQNGNDFFVFLLGLEAAVQKGPLGYIKEVAFTSVSAVGAVGDVTVDIRYYGDLTWAGQELAIQQGELTASTEMDNAVALTGLETVTGQGAFTVITDNAVGIAKATADVASGSVVPGLAVELTGLRLTMLHGASGVDSACALHGLQCAVQSGTIVPKLSVNPAGQQLFVFTPIFIPAMNLRPVGASLQVRSGVSVPHLSPTLSGLSVVTHGGTLRLALAVPLTGQQATVVQGQPGYLYDCNLFLTGVQAVSMLGAEPLLTNVPPPKRDVYMWAKYEVEKLFAGIMPDDLYNDIEPKK